MRGEYILLQIMVGDEYKLAVRTRYDLFEPRAMQFDTTNVPADFEECINNTIREALVDFALAYSMIY